MTKRMRSRSICIRLSEKEYSDLQNLCALAEARNMSVFIRRALRHTLRNVLNESGGRKSPETDFSEIQREIIDVKKKLEVLEEGIRKHLSAHNGPKNSPIRTKQNDN